MNIRSQRGVVDPLTWIIVAAVVLGTGALAGLKIPNPFANQKAKDAIKQVPVLQKQIADTTAERDQARKEAADARGEAKKDLDFQLQDIQFMNEGVILAGKQVPVEHLIAPVQLMNDFSLRVKMRLIAIRGNLDPKLEDELEVAVGNALNKQRADLQAQFAKDMKAKDDAFVEVNGKWKTAETTAVIQTARADGLDAKIKVTEAKLNAVTAKAVTWIKAKLQSDGFVAEAKGAGLRILIILIGYVALKEACAWIFPGWIQKMPTGPLKTGFRWTTGVIAGGLHFIDAHQKLSARPPAQLPTPNPPTS